MNKAAKYADIKCYTKSEQQYLVCVAVRTHISQFTLSYRYQQNTV